MTKQQITRLSTVKRVIISTKKQSAVQAIFLNSEQYEEMKSQLDKSFEKNGLKRLVFADGEITVINKGTVVFVNDL